jgi:transposase InsO family protein
LGTWVTVAGKEVSLPWKDLSLVQQRKAFVDEYLKQLDSVSELCRRFSVSRKTAYKWIDRFLAGCELTDRSRRPHSSPSATAATLEEAIVAARKDRPRWGPKKLRAMLLRAHPGIELPSISTFAAIFKRHGLVVPRRRRRRTPPSSNPLSGATHPNALWCIDFKGDFLVGKSRCYPLTVTDAHSRFLLGCIALPNTRFAGVQRALVTLFQTFGLPDAIRSDNGSPFASKAPAGLSELSAWWLKLGIRHERIEPGKPQQNGRHERMHLTLKVATASPPASSRKAQQRSFDRFRLEYNEQRPHEALGQRFPADFYCRSSRVLPEPYWGRDFNYPAEYERSRVRNSGHLAWNDRSVFISAALKHQWLGLEWQTNGSWRVFFCNLPIGTLSGSRFTPL